MVEVAGHQRSPRLLLRRQLVARHAFDRWPGQDALVPMPPLLQHHPAECQAVVDGRDQTAGARWECGRAAPFAARRFVLQLERPGLSVCPVTGREPIELFCRHAESGVLHAQRGKDSLAHERLQRLSRGPRDQHAQHVGPRVVHPFLARLAHQRQRPQAADPLIRPRRRRWARRALAEEQLAHGPLYWIRFWRCHDQAEAHAKRQQVAH